LGTGGPIKNAEKLIGRKEPFLVLNGDILTNFDYTNFMKKHIEKGARATIALYRVDDPSRYGVAELTEKNRVVRFVEKPIRNKAPSNLINAGVYCLEPEVFDYIPREQPVSIERQVFPRLAEEGKLYGCDFKGFWIDIGEPEDYLKANELLLDIEIKESQLGKSVHVKSSAEVQKPTVIGDGAVIGEESKIGPHAAIGERVTLGKEVSIQNSIIFPGTTISDFTSIKGAVIGEDVRIGRRVKIENVCLVGDHSVIEDNVTLTRGVTVCPSRVVSESVLTPRCLM